MSIVLEDNMKILFQGDSITDCGRRNQATAPMGYGYAFMAASRLHARFPRHKLEFVNRGVSGNRTRDLVDRWSADCIALEPGLLSILIGVNDVWRKYDSADPTAHAAFEKEYQQILARARNEIDPVMVLCEPFVLPFPEDRKAWREDLDPKREIVRMLARRFDALFIPLQEIFVSAARHAPCDYWTRDGVHPTPAGHALIAQSWIDYVIA
jgi:acyl-CoA thioesterase I